MWALQWKASALGSCMKWVATKNIIISPPTYVSQMLNRPMQQVKEYCTECGKYQSSLSVTLI